MTRGPLSPKSSAGELWKEVSRLRRMEGEGKRTVPRARFDETTSELERTRARESAVLDELAALRMAASEQGIERDSVAGKPALAKMRRTWRDFADAVMRLPSERDHRGKGYARWLASTELSADLDLFELDAPHGRTAAFMRDRLRRQLTNPAHLAVLSSEGAAGDYHRTLFLATVARYFLRPSVWRTYEKASDEGIRDALGTVFK